MFTLGLNRAQGIIAQLPISESIHCTVAYTYREKQHSGCKKFHAPLATASKVVLSSVANNCIVNKRRLTELCALLAIRILIA
jgi:hypothetical protein